MYSEKERDLLFGLRLESALSWAATHASRALAAPSPAIRLKHLQLSKEYIEEAEVLLVKPNDRRPNLCSEIPLENYASPLFKGNY